MPIDMLRQEVQVGCECVDVWWWWWCGGWGEGARCAAHARVCGESRWDLKVVEVEHPLPQREALWRVDEHLSVVAGPHSLGTALLDAVGCC